MAKAHIEYPLTQGLTTKIDVEEYERVAGESWHAWKTTRNAYAHRNKTLADGRRVMRKLHREIVGAPEGMQVDHINGDGLDNRKENLRLATLSENRRNFPVRRDSTSGYRGVGHVKRSGRWVAYINHEGQRHHIGYFDEATDAARAYNKAALEFHGEYARINEIVEAA